MDDSTIARLRSRTLMAARATDTRRRRRHRGGAVLGSVLVAALLTAGGVALTVPSPPPPLPSDEARDLYEAAIEGRWAELEEQYPGAVRPDVEFERFISAEEEPQVIAACLQEQGIPAVLDENGVTTTTPIGREQQYDLAWFACEVRFPTDPSNNQPFTDDELHYTYRYFVDELGPCLESRGYELPAAPEFSEFRERWWTDDTWSPYRDLVENDGDALVATQEACPPMPSDLRP